MREVAAVIVSYHPDLPVLEQMLELISPQVEVVYVVDNGSGAETAGRLQAMADGRNVEVVLLPANLGIAAAHNAGLDRAMQRGLAFAVLFDQDSLPATDLVERLVNAHGALCRPGVKVAAVGPTWVDERSGRKGQFYRICRGRIVGMDALENGQPQEVDFLISSGTLASLSAVKEIGKMREDLFIDHVDTEWCVRAKAAGWKLFGVGAASIRHSLGDDRRRVWLGRWREVAVHSPDRNYYEVRNTLLLLKTPGIDLSWRVAQWTRLTQLFAFYVLLLAPRQRRLMRMLRGLRDGAMGRGGQLR